MKEDGFFDMQNKNNYRIIKKKIKENNKVMKKRLNQGRNQK